MKTKLTSNDEAGWYVGDCHGCLRAAQYDPLNRTWGYVPLEFFNEYINFERLYTSQEVSEKVMKILRDVDDARIELGKSRLELDGMRCQRDSERREKEKYKEVLSDLHKTEDEKDKEIAELKRYDDYYKGRIKKLEADIAAIQDIVNENAKSRVQCF